MSSLTVEEIYDKNKNVELFGAVAIKSTRFHPQIIL